MKPRRSVRPRIAESKDAKPGGKEQRRAWQRGGDTTAPRAEAVAVIPDRQAVHEQQLPCKYRE